MTLHLIRHFKVTESSPLWLTPKEFNEWIDIYDTSPINPFPVTLPQKIDLFLCSTYSRTRRSIKSITQNEVIYLESLIEVDPKVECTIKLKLPKYLWFFISRWKWYKNKLQGENLTDSQLRAKELLNYVRESQKEDVFILSHGFFMKVLEKELLVQGFKGKMNFRPRNGKIYTFKNQ